jgi:hypothetical protein
MQRDWQPASLPSLDAPPTAPRMRPLAVLVLKQTSSPASATRAFTGTVSPVLDVAHAPQLTPQLQLSVQPEVARMWSRASATLDSMETGTRVSRAESASRAIRQ